MSTEAMRDWKALVTEAEIGEQADFTKIFGRSAPVELEIGSGKGTFLVRHAAQHSDRDFLGIEWASKFCKHAADRMERHGLRHVRLLRADGRHFVIHRVPANSLAALHVYHPDPWPKKRHHKRRLFNSEFIDAAVRALTVGGRLAFQSDHQEYFESTRPLLLGHPAFTECAFGDEAFGASDEGVATNFEIKYTREGRPIYRMAVRRTGTID